MTITERLFVFIGLLLIGIFHGNLAFPYSAPDPAKTFYADATGDQILGADDLPLHKTQVLGGYPNYNTPQLNNLADRWNTCDVTADFVCGADDLNPIKAAIVVGLRDFADIKKCLN